MTKMQRNIKFSLRKLAVGLASVGIGYFVAGHGVYAADVDNSSSEAVVSALEEEKNEVTPSENVAVTITDENLAASVENQEATASLKNSDDVSNQDRAAESSKETTEEKNLDNKTSQSADKLTVETSDTLEKDKNYYEASKFDGNKVLELTNVSTTTNKNIDLTSDLDKIKALDSATIYLEFKAKEGQSGTYSLFSASSATNSRSYYAVGVMNGSTPFVGAPNQGSQLYGGELKAGTIDGTSWNSLAVSINRTNTEGAGRIDVYLNGQYLFHSSKAGKFLKDFTDLTNMQLGRMNNGGNNIWGADVDYRNFTIYNKALSASEVAERSKNFNKLPNDVVNEDGKVLTEGQPVFTKAQYPSTGAYRIPALLKTKDGTLIAGVDERPSTGDYGDIAMVVRTSDDNGKTWNDKTTIFNIRNSPALGRSDQPSTMDMALVQDPATGKVFAFYDLFPEGKGMLTLPNFGKGERQQQVYQEIDGKNYQILYRNADGAKFTIREDGVVYDANNQKTEYRVNLTPEKGTDPAKPYENYGDIYDSKGRIGNVYFKTKSDFTVAYTSYIMMSESSDNGKTWSAPRNISDMVRTPDMEFQGIGPGTAIVLKEGEHKGRIIVPTYTRNAEGTSQKENTRVIYSDDKGLTWKTSEMVVPNSTNSEAAVVELSNGDLKIFMRTGGNIQMATSKDGGVTWINPVTTNLPSIRTQISAITTTQDGKEYVLVANAGQTRRIDGYVNIGEVKSDGSIDWIEKKLIQKGIFAYNSIQDLGNGEFGILYEHGGDANYPQEMYYKTMNWKFLTDKADPIVIANVSKLTNQSDVVALSYNQSVVASDNLVLKLSNGKTLPLVAQYDATTLLFKWDKDADQGATIVGVEAGTLDSLQNYKLDISASLPYTLESKEVNEVIAFDTYYKGDENLAYGESREETGKVGSKKITTTYSVDENGKVIEKVTTTIVSDPVAHVIVKGTKPTVVEKKTDLPVEYVADPDFAYGETSKTEGSPKVDTETTTYEVDATTGNITPTTTTATTDNGKAAVVYVGTKATTSTTDVDFGTTYVADDTLDLNTTKVKTAGAKGTDTTTTTYKLEGDKAVVDKVTTSRTTESTTEVILVGTKPTVVISEVDFGTTYVADDTLAYGETSEEAGIVGTKETTTTYKLEGDKAVVDTTSEKVTTQPKNKVVKVGTKPSTSTTDVDFATTYEADDTLDLNTTKVKTAGAKGTDTTTTTYKLENGKAVEDKTTTERTTQPKAQIIKVGTHPTRVETEIASPIRYEADANLEYGKTTTTEGQKGLSTVTTTYEVNSATGEVTSHVSGAVVEKEATETVIKIGNMKVEKEKIAPQTTYVADENLAYNEQQVANEGASGEQTTTTTYKVDANGNLVDPTVTTSVTKDVVNKVVKVGNVTTTTNPIAIVTTYVDDNENFVTSEIVEAEGSEGESKTTTTYAVNAQTGALENPTAATVTMKEMQNRVIKRGTLSVTAANEESLPLVTETSREVVVEENYSTTYVADENLVYGTTSVEVAGQKGRKVTTINEATLNGEVVAQSQVVTEDTPVRNAVIKVGTRPTRVESEIASPVRYEADANLEYGKTTTTEGQKGLSVVTTTYEVNSVTGEVTSHVSEAAVEKEATETVVKVGTKATTTTAEVNFETTYEADTNLDFGKTEVRSNGAKGTDTTITTYKLEGDKAVVDKVTTTRTQEPKAQVVVIGTKPTVVISEVAFDTNYVADSNLDFGKTEEIAGVVGTKATTTTYKLEGNQAVVDTTSERTTVEPKNRIVKVGNVKVEKAEIAPQTTYVADETLAYNEQQAANEGVSGEQTTTTTYKVDASGNLVDPTVTTATTKAVVNKVVKVGNVEKTINEIAIETVERVDSELEVGKTSETEGQAGEATTTTTYEVNAETGALENPKSETKVTKEMERKVIHIGTKVAQRDAEGFNNVIEEAKKQIEASNLSQEEKAKQLELISNTNAKDRLIAKVGDKEIAVTLDNSKLGAEKLIVVESERSAEVRNLVASELPNSTVVDSYDIHLVDQDNNIINRSGESRALTVAVTKADDETVEVYYVNGETLEKIPSVYQNGELTFFTNHFSTYTIVKTKTPQPQPQPDPEKPDKPQPQPDPEKPDKPQPQPDPEKPDKPQPQPDPEKPDQPKPQPETPDQPEKPENPEQPDNGKDAADKDKNSESNKGKRSDENKDGNVDNNFQGNNEKITKTKLPNTDATNNAAGAGIIALVGAAVAARRKEDK